MTKHVKIKHKIQTITKTTFNEIMDEAMLSENEMHMMRMYYIEHKNLDYIADTLGYSRAGIIKMHQRILQKIESLL